MFTNSPLCVNACNAFHLYFFLLQAYICVYCIKKITMLLVKSDISAGNSLSVPQLTAVHCHYLAFLLTSLPFLK